MGIIVVLFKLANQFLANEFEVNNKKMYFMTLKVNDI
jgi:hypothetical protein